MIIATVTFAYLAVELDCKLIAQTHGKLLPTVTEEKFVLNDGKGHTMGPFQIANDYGSFCYKSTDGSSWQYIPIDQKPVSDQLGQNIGMLTDSIEAVHTGNVQYKLQCRNYKHCITGPFNNAICSAAPKEY